MTEKEQEANAVLQEIAKDIIEKLPEKMGFALLAYEFGPVKEGEEHKMLYVSNSQREDVILAMTEFIKKQLEDPKIFGKDA